MKLKMVLAYVLLSSFLTSLDFAMAAAEENALKQVFFRSSVLSLASKGLSDEQVSNLANILEGSPHITQLDLNHNGFGDPGVQALSAKLPALPNLTTLNLYGANITDSGFNDLFTAIERCPKLNLIDIRETLISGAGIVRLSELCARRPKLVFHSSFRSDSAVDLIHRALGSAPREQAH